MKIYCQKCGNASEYSFDKPKFCSGCGSSFVIASSFAAKAAKPVNSITQKQLEEEIATERVPDISKLEFDIDVNPRKGVKLNNLMGTHNGQTADEPAFSVLRISKEQALEDFKREAGYYPSRQATNEEE